MANYYSPTIIQPTIPVTDISPLESLILGKIFQAEVEKDRVSFFSESGPDLAIIFTTDELKSALAASVNHPTNTVDYVTKCLEETDPADTEINIDFDDLSWDNIFQDIVIRSPTLTYVTAVSAFHCDKMRADGFGGSATLITADRIVGRSTNDILEELMNEAKVTVETSPTAV